MLLGKDKHFIKLIVLMVFLFLNAVNAMAIITSAAEPNCNRTFGPNQHCFDGDSESFLAFKLNSFVGDRTKSLTGSYSYNLSFTSVTGKDNFSFLLGGQLGYGSVSAYINNGSALIGKYTSLDIPVGVSIKFFKSNRIRPILDLYGLVGFKSLDLSSPPTGVDNKTIGLSYGYGGSFGLEFNIGNYTSLRGTMDYETNTAQSLANQSGFNLSALCFKFGIVFAEFDEL